MEVMKWVERGDRGRAEVASKMKEFVDQQLGNLYSYLIVVAPEALPEAAVEHSDYRDKQTSISAAVAAPEADSLSPMRNSPCSP
jgi:hypothetical protein